LPQLLHIIGAFQGHSLLNQGIYGAIFPQTLSLTTLGFTLTTICCTSALAGALAAIRACNMNVSEALKS
jgi:ABC-type lipoprotein release transport system permease subunit